MRGKDGASIHPADSLLYWTRHRFGMILRAD